jgi:hypothetical protein
VSVGVEGGGRGDGGGRRGGVRGRRIGREGGVGRMGGTLLMLEIRMWSSWHTARRTA